MCIWRGEVDMVEGVSPTRSMWMEEMRVQRSGLKSEVNGRYWWLADKGKSGEGGGSLIFSGMNWGSVLWLLMVREKREGYG